MQCIVTVKPNNQKPHATTKPTSSLQNLPFYAWLRTYSRGCFSIQIQRLIYRAPSVPTFSGPDKRKSKQHQTTTAATARVPNRFSIAFCLHYSEVFLRRRCGGVEWRQECPDDQQPSTSGKNRDNCWVFLNSPNKTKTPGQKKRDFAFVQLLWKPWYGSYHRESSVAANSKQ